MVAGAIIPEGEPIEALATFVARTRIEDVPPDMAEKARWHMLDTFGAALAGSTSEEADRSPRALFEADGTGPARDGELEILGPGRDLRWQADRGADDDPAGVTGEPAFPRGFACEIRRIGGPRPAACPGGRTSRARARAGSGEDARALIPLLRVASAAVRSARDAHEPQEKRDVA